MVAQFGFARGAWLTHVPLYLLREKHDCEHCRRSSSRLRSCEREMYRLSDNQIHVQRLSKHMEQLSKQMEQQPRRPIVLGKRQGHARGMATLASKVEGLLTRLTQVERRPLLQFADAPHTGYGWPPAAHNMSGVQGGGGRGG